jgi:hypothetical protein
MVKLVKFHVISGVVSYNIYYIIYSSNLGPSDCHLFGPLKEALRGRLFTSDQKVKEAVHEELTALPETFFSEGIRNLVQ